MKGKKEYRNKKDQRKRQLAKKKLGKIEQKKSKEEMAQRIRQQ